MRINLWKPLLIYSTHNTREKTQPKVRDRDRISYDCEQQPHQISILQTRQMFVTTNDENPKPVKSSSPTFQYPLVLNPGSIPRIQKHILPHSNLELNVPAYRMKLDSSMAHFSGTLGRIETSAILNGVDKISTLHINFHLSTLL